MPNLTLPLLDGEPVVDVQIGLVPLQASTEFQMKGLAVPPPVTARFLLDTGASHCVVVGERLRALGVPVAGRARIRTATGDQWLARYRVSLMIRGSVPGQAWFVPEVAISGADDHAFSGAPYVGLVGRDVLNDGLMIYNGRNAHLTLAY